MSIELILLAIITILEFIAFGLIVYEIRNNKTQHSSKEEELMKKIEDLEESICVLAEAVTTFVQSRSREQ
tara:strand:+ start:177 stop:386 length:210 start_codon:yes stop_codon:yes gene_type:complete